VRRSASDPQLPSRVRLHGRLRAPLLGYLPLRRAGFALKTNALIAVGLLATLAVRLRHGLRDRAAAQASGGGRVSTTGWRGSASAKAHRTTCTQNASRHAIAPLLLSHNHGHFDLGWSLVMLALRWWCWRRASTRRRAEILAQGLRAWQLRRADPTRPSTRSTRVERELETGEFPALEPQRDR
jgi:hypothetical protein